MSVSRYAAISLVSGTLALCGTQSARAQTSTAFADTNNFSFNGLTVSIAGCTFFSNGSTSTPCSSDGVKLQQVADGRGNVLLELLPTSGTTLFPSAAAGTLNGLQYTLTVSTNTPATATVSSYALNIYGTNPNGAANNFYGTATNTSTEIIASLATNGTSATASQSFSTPVSTFNVSGGLLESPNTGFTLTSATFLFRTVPEPASISLVAAGIGALTLVRKRRRAKADTTRTDQGQM